MVKKALILLFLFSAVTHAKVTVLSSNDCSGRLLRRSVEKISYGDYVEEAYLSLFTVEKAYWEIFRKRGMSTKEARELIHKMDDDTRLAVGTGEDVNGLDNTVYFISRRSDGTARAVLRATLIRKSEKRKLPAESHIILPDENRVELERAFNSPDSIDSGTTDEILRAAAEHFKNYFKDNNYTIYALTDSARARLYRSRYGFEITLQPGLDPMYRYLARQSGENFFHRYVGRD